MKASVRFLRCVLLWPCLPGVLSFVLSVALAMGCGAEASPRESEASGEDAFTASDFAEDRVLPYAGAWLDAPHALAGVGQFDRLRGTIHDDSKCSTMVALAAAVVGGHDRFLNLVGEAERLRVGRRDDLAILTRVREAVAAKKLTPRNLHELTEVLVRAYGVAHGAYDGQISRMVRASGFAIVHVGTSRPSALVAALGPGDVVPMTTVADGEGHVTLLWKDAHGIVRLYDSDDIHGPHVLPRGSALYHARVDAPTSAWSLAETYR